MQSILKISNTIKHNKAPYSPGVGNINSCYASTTTFFEFITFLVALAKHFVTVYSNRPILY